MITQAFSIILIILNEMICVIVERMELYYLKSPLIIKHAKQSS